MPLQTRTLGQTQLQVTPIGLGVMQFSGANGMYRWLQPDISQTDKNAIVQAALDGGINWFDTAELYGRGNSERSLAAALQAANVTDGQVSVCTKWWPMFRTARSIPVSIEERRRNLSPYTIDLFMVHNPMSFSSVEAEMHAMADLVEAGKIRAVGVSNFDPNQMERAHKTLHGHGLSLAVNQVHYNLLHRDIESSGVLQAAKDLGVTIVCWGPLGSGLLTGKYHRSPDAFAQAVYAKRVRMKRAIEGSRPVVEELVKLAEKYSATPAQIALNWLIHFHGETVVAIPGASKVKHAVESAGAMQFTLSAEDLARLDEVSRQ